MLATIIISLLVISVVALIIRKMLHDKRSGKSSCGCDCQSCHMCSCCSQPQDDKRHTA
ncbi:MAG: FeoB-associated Cys-rich membrane protein [Oscillospiraceae bacterium]|nr:FeoB-associated Cys-rich membrane protein [Oscillospiraceae bacterium]